MTKPSAKKGRPKGTPPAKPKTTAAPAAFVKAMPAPKGDAEPSGYRDELGRFVTGNIGGPGRPPGAKNKLAENFIEDFHNAWRQHGATALDTMATSEPSAFVRAAVQLMPKDVLLDARGAGLVVIRMDDTDLGL